MQKFYAFIGRAAIGMFILSCIIITTVYINDVLYEVEKEEIFFEMYGIFERDYEHRKKQIYDDNGLLDSEDLKNESQPVSI